MYMEQWISDDFGWDKWCNNYDHFNKELLELHPEIDAFIHFVHTKTGGAFMILDIQGGFLKRVNGTTIFKLSDPAFTSTLGS